MNQKLPTLVSLSEQEKISRALLVWLNEYPDKPTPVNFEFLSAGRPDMAISTIQGAYKTRAYVRGGYQAQVQFKLIYRAQPQFDGDRLAMDELLDAFADWAASRRPLPDIGAGKRVLRIVSNTRASLFGRTESGDEDHQILMTMDYISMGKE